MLVFHRKAVRLYVIIFLVNISYYIWKSVLLLMSFVSFPVPKLVFVFNSLVLLWVLALTAIICFLLPFCIKSSSFPMSYCHFIAFTWVLSLFLV